MDELSKQQTLLIVDDARENIIFLAENLRSDFKIRAVTSGQKALDIAFSEEPPDLILLDIEMPDMSGHDVCKRLKDSMKTKSIPIIFVTGRMNEADEIYGLKLGAVDYITKPFNPYIVKARIDAHAELKRYRDYLESISYVDSLTKIANRRKFDEHLELIWNMGKREKMPVSLVMFDIDQFKKYNDTYGHKAGDICLIQVGEALSDIVLRKTDLIARYGGEEFACILPNAGINNAVMISERLRLGVAMLKIPHKTSDVSNIVTVSAGVACHIPEIEDHSDIIVKAADEALYRAKENGRNNTSI